jgi:hypothetical protein
MLCEAAQRASPYTVIPKHCPAWQLLLFFLHVHQLAVAVLVEQIMG